jgi:hypothetical protein
MDSLMPLTSCRHITSQVRAQAWTFCCSRHKPVILHGFIIDRIKNLCSTPLLHGKKGGIYKFSFALDNGIRRALSIEPHTAFPESQSTLIKTVELLDQNVN